MKINGTENTFGKEMKVMCASFMSGKVKKGKTQYMAHTNSKEL